MRPRQVVIAILSFLLLLFTPPASTWPILSLREADRLVEQKEYARALERYMALSNAAKPSALHARIGKLHLQKARLDDASAHFELALALDANDADALLGLGLVASWRNEYGKAIEALEKARSARPDDPEIALQLGEAQLQAFDFERASATFRGVIDMKNSSGWEARARYNLGLASLPRDIDLARTLFASVPRYVASKEMYRGTPSDADVAGLARVVQRVIEELGAMQDQEAHVAARLGHALLQVDQKRLARWHLEKAVALRPDYADARAYLGYTYWLDGRPQEALATLADAARLDPAQPLTHYLLGIVLRGERRNQEAIAELREAIRLDQESAEAQVELARTLALASRYGEARDAFARAMELRPAEIEIKLVAIWFHLDHLFEVERGLAIAKQVAEAGPVSAETQDAVGWALYVNGHPDEAEAALRQAVAAAPFSAKTHYHLAVLLEQRGSADRAETEYLRAIDLDTEGQIAERAANAIRTMRGS